jgi:hypothetical protein
MHSRTTQNPEQIRHYEKYCKVLTEVTKKSFYNKLISNSTNKIKTSWGIVKDVTNTRLVNNSVPSIKYKDPLFQNKHEFLQDA